MVDSDRECPLTAFQQGIKKMLCKVRKTVLRFPKSEGQSRQNSARMDSIWA